MSPIIHHTISNSLDRVSQITLQLDNINANMDVKVCLCWRMREERIERALLQAKLGFSGSGNKRTFQLSTTFNGLATQAGSEAQCGGGGGGFGCLIHSVYVAEREIERKKELHREENILHTVPSAH